MSSRLAVSLSNVKQQLRTSRKIVAIWVAC